MQSLFSSDKEVFPLVINIIMVFDILLCVIKTVRGGRRLSFVGWLGFWRRRTRLVLGLSL